MATSKRVPRGPSKGRPKRILIVDDEESLAFFLQQGLVRANAGWEVDIANTGEEAVVKINRHAYGLIIADFRMPGLNGLELLQMVRALEPDTRVILMTAYGSEQIEKEAHRLGVYRYITKPFPIEDMVQFAYQALEERPEIPAAESKAQGAKAMPGKPEETSGIAQVTEAARPGEHQPVAEAAERSLVAYLAEFRFRQGAQYVFLADRAGKILGATGALKGLDVAAFAPLLAEGFRVTLQANALLGERGLLVMAYRGESKYHVYSVSIAGEWILAIFFDKSAPLRRLESVLNYLSDSASELRSLLSESFSPAERLSAIASALEDLPDAPMTQDAPDAQSGLQASHLAQRRDRGEAKQEDAEDSVSRGGASFSLEEAHDMGLISDELFAKLISDEGIDQTAS